MSLPKDSLSPVVVNVVVEMPSDDAFDLFTRRIGEWWPLATHSVGGEAATEVHFEARPGGRIYEVDSDGSRHSWGEVVECELPRRVLFTWHPGRPEETKQVIEVLFSPDGPLTHVELVHGEWEALGESAEGLREEYATGWETLLGERFAAARRD
jgi:uncharacterized protein YndB with AHSA1/START domain